MYIKNFIKEESGATIDFIKDKFIIRAQKGAIYVSEFLNSLPIGILNKKNTGCGATSVALENEENTIICCPSKLLIKNKIQQYPNETCDFTILGVLEGVYKRDILKYVSECKEKGQPIKIMVTYDSFYKVKNALEEDIIDFRIIVDEYQEILDGITYRSKAILGILRDVKMLPFVTYLSATPIPFKFKPDELKGLKEFEIDWGEEIRLKPKRIKTNKPYAVAVNMILEKKMDKPFEVEGVKVQEYFFFINSVTAIKTIIDNSGLTNDEVRVICSNSLKNRGILKEIEISEVDNQSKPFTFCTKSVFYGADFHSKSGLIIIVSECRNKNTMLDIATDIQQIAGRIRDIDNPFKGVIFHIYNTGIGNMSKEEFQLYLKDKIDSAEEIIELYNNLFTTIKGKKAIAERVKMEDKDELALYNEQDKTLTLNQLKISHMKYKFESVEDVYRNGLGIREAYIRNNWDITQAQKFELVTEKFAKKMKRTPTFKSLYEEYTIERSKIIFGKTDRAKSIEEINEIIPLAYQYLLPEEVKSTCYNVTDIKNIIHSRKPNVKEALIELLYNEIKLGYRYSLTEAKEILQNNYDKLTIRIAAKATDLKKFFNIKENVKLWKNGKRVDGIEILDRVGTIMFLHQIRNNYLLAS